MVLLRGSGVPLTIRTVRVCVYVTEVTVYRGIGVTPVLNHEVT